METVTPEKGVPSPATIARVLRHLAKIPTIARKRASRENLKKARALRWKKAGR